jgi:hypothetical protein
VQVRAEDENDVGLSWSVEAKSNKARTFRNTLARPVQTGDNLSRSDFIPTWSWNFIPGAPSYDLHVELPDGTTRDFPNMLPTAFTPIRMTGTGVFHWQVRAEFPQARDGKTAQGPYSARMAFYWRVTAVDASGNTGNSTPVQAFRLSASRSK